MADAKQGQIPEDFCNGASQSRVVLAKPRLGGFGSNLSSSNSGKTCNPFGSVLRPSTLKPGSNPFLKVSENEDKNDKEQKKEDTEEERINEAEEKPETPKFVPLGTTTPAPRPANPVPAPVQPVATSSSGFVFGQNLSERVVMENMNNGDAGGDTGSSDHSSSNGTSELLFTTAASTVKENCLDEPSSSTGQTSSSGPSASEGLVAAAAAYEREHARPPPPAEHHSITGEEGETNVLQISCRLFAWESGSWRERGRGVLRLNDAAGGGARVVARVSGSLRVVLNTQLWPGMVVERAGTKSLRITAADAAQQVKVYLIMGAPADIVQLYRALAARIAVSSKKTNCAQNTTSQQAAERLEAAADESEFLDLESDNNKDNKENETTTDKPDSKDTERLNSEQKVEETEPNDSEDDGTNLKRKEQTEGEIPQKRPCPDIVIEH